MDRVIVENPKQRNKTRIPIVTLNLPYNIDSTYGKHQRPKRDGGKLMDDRIRETIFDEVLFADDTLILSESTKPLKNHKMYEIR